jgi:hypothetical protein
LKGKPYYSAAVLSVDNSSPGHLDVNRTDLRRLICQKLFAGQLPATGVMIYGGTAASGETCDACAASVLAGQVIIHGLARSKEQDESVRFHLVCFDVWDRERRLLSVLPRASSPRERPALI